MKLHALTLTAIALATTTMAACARTPPPAEPRVALSAAGLVAPAVRMAAATPATAARTTPASTTLPLLVVHKSASCGCCALWVNHMREAGFPIEVRNSDNLHPVKQRVGVPLGQGSCHTAEVGGYFVEGHIPADDVKRLLSERPDAKGLLLPGMPLGSPGMEIPDGRTQPYTVGLVNRDGTVTAFAEH